MVIEGPEKDRQLSSSTHEVALLLKLFKKGSRAHLSTIVVVLSLGGHRRDLRFHHSRSLKRALALGFAPGKNLQVVISYRHF